MDLKIKDVVELLNVSETTIRRWIIEGKIPAYRLNHQYRFSRFEIENWMMKNKMEKEATKEVSTSEPEQIFPKKEGKEHPAHQGLQQFSLYRAIHRGGVHFDLGGTTKEEVICAATLRIAEILQADAEILSELLLDRERLMPTALNGGIAVPHSRECLQRIPFDLISVVFPEKPLEYGALDGKPVHTLFFLFASTDKMHLHLLSKLAHLSNHPETLAFFASRPEKKELLEYIKEWESSLRA